MEPGQGPGNNRFYETVEVVTLHLDQERGCYLLWAIVPVPIPVPRSVNTPGEVVLTLAIF